MKFRSLAAVAFAAALTFGCNEKKAEAAAPEAEAPATDAAAALAALEEVAPAPAAAAVDPAAPVATLADGSVLITEGDLQAAMERGAARFGGLAAIPDAYRAQFRTQTIDQLVGVRLLMKEAKAQGIVVSDDDLLAALKELTGDPEATYEKISKQVNIPEEEVKSQLTDMTIVRKLYEKVTADVPAASEEEAKAQFDKIVAANPDAAKKPASCTASHILVKVDKGADEATKTAAKEKIEAARKRIVEGGEDFAAVAKEVSDCPSSARGGDLGSFGKGQMVKPFEEAAFAQEVNKVGDIVETDFGYHIILVKDRVEEGTVAFDDVKAEIIQSLSGQKKGEAMEKFIADLKEKAGIKIAEAPAAPAAEEAK